MSDNENAAGNENIGGTENAGDIIEIPGDIEKIEDYIEAPKKRGGLFNIITMQAIICTTVMIGAVLLGTFAPPAFEYCRRKYATLSTVDVQTFFRVVNEKYEAFLSIAGKTNAPGSVKTENKGGDFLSSGAQPAAADNNSATGEASSSASSASSDLSKNAAQSASSLAKSSDAKKTKNAKKAGKSAALPSGAGGAPNAVEMLGEVPAGATVLPVKVTIPLTPPTKTGRISSFFGQRIHPITKKYEFHTGLDIAAAKNTPVYSTADGVVLEAARSEFLGKYIYIKHADGFYSKYGHLNKKYVKPGQSVKAGQLIGRVGTTGFSTGYHLHLQLKKHKTAFNPLFVFKYA